MTLQSCAGEMHVWMPKSELAQKHRLLSGAGPRTHHVPPAGPRQIYELQNQCSNTGKSGAQEEEWRSDSPSREGTLAGGNDHTILQNTRTAASAAGEAPSCPCEFSQHFQANLPPSLRGCRGKTCFSPPSSSLGHCRE